MNCNLITNGTKFSTWNGAGAGASSESGVLLNQPFESWNFGWGGFRIIKVIKYKPDGKTPDWFEVRGKDAYKNFTPFATGIDGTEVNCANILGNLIYLNVDSTVTTATGYVLDGTVFKAASLSCPTPTITISTTKREYSIGNTITFTAQVTNSTSYQWYKNSSIIVGATSSTYTKDNCTVVDAGIYYCKAVNSCGGGNSDSQKDSNTITISVLEGIKFKVNAEIVEGSPIGLDSPLEYGYHRTSNLPSSVSNWQDSDTFDLVEEGNYYFFVRIKADTSAFFVSLINTNILV